MHSELEAGAEEHPMDPLSKKVGLLAAAMAVMLAAATISSHRSHTAGVILKADANDKWSYYQAKSIKSHTYKVGEDLLAAIPNATPEAHASATKYHAERERYEKESEEILSEAKTLEKRSEAQEHKALRFDLGEGLIEVGMVLASLFFISKRGIFPVVGAIAGITGIAIAITGWMMP